MSKYRLTFKGRITGREYVVTAEADGTMQALINGTGALARFYKQGYGSWPDHGIVVGNFQLIMLEREEVVPATTTWQSIPLN